MSMDTEKIDNRNLDQGNPAGGDHAYLLVKALGTFILPIIHAHVSGIASNFDINGKETQELLAALDNYIASVVKAQMTGSLHAGPNMEEVKLPKEGIALEAVPPTKIDTSTTLYSKDETTSENSPLLKQALEQAHYHVFNKMPIRLLSFTHNGSGIQLIERTVIWERISTAIELDLRESGKIKSALPNLGQDKGRNEAGAQKKLIDDLISTHTRYAILSHTWLRSTPGELTYADWKRGTFDKRSAGYHKLASFCEVAAINHEATLGWMDTICINKDSSSELDESIRSMYKWYRDASVCIAYLAQTRTLTDIRNDPWFTRGWTLQELLAPRFLKLYGKNWEKVLNDDWDDDKQNPVVQQEIEAATTITGSDLSYFQDGSQEYVSISQKMQWAANRRVTREEDTSYSLMGIFDVSIAIAYGEGSELAFLRLVKEILSTTKNDVLDIANWGSGPFTSSHQSSSKASWLIPTSPKQYHWRTTSGFMWLRSQPPIPIILTHLGIKLPVLLLPAISVDPNFPDAQCDPIGKYYANAVKIDVPVDTLDNHGSSGASTSHRVHVLDKRTSLGWKTSKWNHDQDRFQLCLGVLNISDNGTTISVPGTLFAIGLSFPPIGNINNSVEIGIYLMTVKRIPTSRAIAFNLHRRGYAGGTSSEISKSDLAQHGMHFVTMYL